MATNKLLEVQREVGKIKKTKTNPFFKSKYADINDYLDALKPILEKHGLGVLQPIQTTIAGNNAYSNITTLIVDNATGENLGESEFLLPQLDDPQKMGSAITYYRRYALQSLFALEASDDDGNFASGNTAQSAPKPVTAQPSASDNGYKHSVPGCKFQAVPMPSGAHICDNPECSNMNFKG